MLGCALLCTHSRHTGRHTDQQVGESLEAPLREVGTGLVRQRKRARLVSFESRVPYAFVIRLERAPSLVSEPQPVGTYSPPSLLSALHEPLRCVHVGLGNK